MDRTKRNYPSLVKLRFSNLYYVVYKVWITLDYYNKYVNTISKTTINDNPQLYFVFI